MPSKIIKPFWSFNFHQTTIQIAHSIPVWPHPHWPAAPFKQRERERQFHAYYSGPCHHRRTHTHTHSTTNQSPEPANSQSFNQASLDPGGWPDRPGPDRPSSWPTVRPMFIRDNIGFCVFFLFCCCWVSLKPNAQTHKRADWAAQPRLACSFRALLLSSSFDRSLIFGGHVTFFFGLLFSRWGKWWFFVGFKLIWKWFWFLEIKFIHVEKTGRSFRRRSTNELAQRT